MRRNRSRRRAAEARKIRARLFYVDEQGTGLRGIEQEVLFGEGTAEQARRIVEAQIAPAPEAPRVCHTGRHETANALFHQVR